MLTQSWILLLLRETTHPFMEFSSLQSSLAWDKWGLDRWKSVKDVLQRRKSIREDVPLREPWRQTQFTIFPCSWLRPSYGAPGPCLHVHTSQLANCLSETPCYELLQWVTVWGWAGLFDLWGSSASERLFWAVPAASALQKLWSLHPSSTPQHTLFLRIIRCLFEFLQHFSLKLWDLTPFLLSLCFFNSFLIFP